MKQWQIMMNEPLHIKCENRLEKSGRFFIPVDVYL